jgi:hypothetical protein
MPEKKKQIWLDSRGKEVPAEYVPELDKLRDAMVRKLHKKAGKIEDAITAFKVEVVKEIKQYLDKVAQVKKVRENWKGNITLDTFDGSLRIERNMDDTIGFDEKLSLVKTMIDKWFMSKLSGMDDSVSKIITQAFNVDKKGRINTAMLMRLFHLDITDSEWKKAMQLLKESMTVTNTRQYINFRKKVDTSTGEEYVNICLNFNNATEGKKVDD